MSERTTDLRQTRGATAAPPRPRPSTDAPTLVGGPTTPPHPGGPRAPLPAGAAPRRWRKRTYAGVALLSGGSALVAGLLLGAVLGTLSSGEELARVTAQAQDATTRAATAEDAAQEAERLRAEAEEAGSAATAALAGAVSERDAARDAAGAASAEVSALEERLAAARAEASTSSSRTGTGSSSASSTQQADAPAAASTSYANCSAVRAAGAAPIRTGDPGYSRKLDRDGDGVACE